VTEPAFWVRPAAPAEEPEVGALLTEVAQWETERGYAGAWPAPFPMERIRPRLLAGDVYLAGPPGAGAVATITLQWEDPAYWGERPPDAGYVHRLAVRPAFHRQGWGGRLLAWAESATREHGRPWLRLDCAAANPRIRRYYAELGFREVGDLVLGGLALQLLEKWIGPGAAATPS
jgi:protein-tyrosine phosphatase